MATESEGFKLEMLLKRHKMTKTQFAEAMGIVRSTLWAKLSQARLEDEFIEKAANILGIDQNEIIDDRTNDQSQGADMVGEGKVPYNREADKATLLAEIEILRQDLAREKKINSELSEAILNLTRSK